MFSSPLSDRTGDRPHDEFTAGGADVGVTTRTMTGITPLQPGMSTESGEYYSRLNLSRDASEDDIHAAFKRLRLLYHPSKFVDPDKEKAAKVLYGTIKEAYDVLSNPVLRAIYDKRGRKGVRNEMDIVKRTALPLELIDKYEEVYNLWEERSYIQASNPRSRIDVDMDARNLIRKGYLGLLVTNVRGSQSVDARISQVMRAHLSGWMSAGKSAPSGGFGMVMTHSHGGDSWQSTMNISQQPSLGLQYNHSLSPYTKINARASVALNTTSLVKLPPKCSLSAHHKFSENLSTRFTVHDVDLSKAESSTSYRFNNTFHVVGGVEVGKTGSAVRAQLGADVSDSCTFNLSFRLSTSGGSVSYGLQHSVAKLTRLETSVSLSRQGVHLRLGMHRTGQCYSVRLHLSDQLGVIPILCASVVPVAAYLCFNVIAILPILRQQREWERKKKLQELEETMKERKAEALAAVELMKETSERIVQVEQAKLGLIITEAWYGKMSVKDNQRINVCSEDEVIDVCVPLQCMVQDSKLIIHPGTKSTHPGFYDPCVGRQKWLFVVYDFRGFQHRVVVEDLQRLGIPKESHRVVTTDSS